MKQSSLEVNDIGKAPRSELEMFLASWYSKLENHKILRAALDSHNTSTTDDSSRNLDFLCLDSRKDALRAFFALSLQPWPAASPFTSFLFHCLFVL